MLGFYNVRPLGGELSSIIWNGPTITDVFAKGNREIPEGVKWTDGKGQELYCAFIDDHVHDRHDEPEKEDPEHLERACHEGGVGTIITMGNGRTEKTAFTHFDQLEDRKRRWNGRLLTVRHNMLVSRNNMGHIASLGSYKDKALGEVKEYDASTNNPAVLIDDLPTQRKAAEAIGKSGRIRLVHAEYEPWLKRTRADIERIKKLEITDHCQLRESAIEVRGIQDAIQVTRETRVRTHICHVSTKAGILLLVDAKEEGLPITFEVCPHYMTLTDEHLNFLFGRAKMNPALRSEEERYWVEEFVCRGYADTIATDHAPHPDKGAIGGAPYDTTPSGVPGVQTMGPVMYRLKHSGRITAERFADLTSRNAAKIFGFNKGELLPGYDADLVLIDPAQTTTFRNEDMLSKAAWTPFHGMTVHGKITTVVIKGQIVKQ